VAALGAKKNLTVLLVIFLRGVSIEPGCAAEKSQVHSSVSKARSAGSPNHSYQSGPHTRVYVSRRSWLDAGTEVAPGDRKFTDYAFPPGYSFARENGSRPLDRQPLNPDSDLGVVSRIPF